MSTPPSAPACSKSPAAAPPGSWRNGAGPGFCAVLFAATLIAYWPALGAGFIWDDSGHVTAPALRPLGGLARIWLEPGATQQYYPLLHSAFWLESHLWGDAAAGYHIVNVLLHATAAWLFAGVLRRLGIAGAEFAALLFALHPVAVESVAWVAEQKNALSAVLYLLAALAYLRFDGDRRKSRYAGATALFLLALCTKTVAATLPAALLVAFWWRRGRLEPRRDVAPLLPWFGLSAIAAVVTSTFEHTLIGAQGADFQLDLVQRCLLAGRAIWFYLGKVVWPANLMFVYPRWSIDAGAAWQYLFPLAAIAAVGACVWKRQRGLLAVLLFFTGTLFPALGFINVYPFVHSFVADHFQYLAMLGICALAGAGTAGFARHARPWLVSTAATIVALALGVLTHVQARSYGNEVILYEATLARNPDAWMAHTNLGIALLNAGRVEDAIRHYETALALRRNYPEGENNLGYALTARGDPAAAVPHLERAIQLQPRYAEAHNNLGIALMKLGRAVEGQAQFETALRLNPRYPEAHFNLGLACATAGRTREAIGRFAEAVRLRPGFGDAELNWAVGLTLSDRFTEAAPHFERAIELQPDSAVARHLFGRALARANRLDEAVAQYRAAIELQPGFAEAHHNLATALRQLGRDAEAAQALQTARQLGARPVP